MASTEEADSTDDMAEGAGDEHVDQTAQAVTISSGGHDYLFVRSPMSWASALTACRRAGYDLATIDDATENAWVLAELGRHGMGDSWIGYHDQFSEGSWVWVDGSVSSYTNWASGEPNNANTNEDCVTMYNSPNLPPGLWNDRHCAVSMPFVCEAAAPASANALPGYSASNTNNATTNTVNEVFWLDAGQVLTAGTCGVPGAALSGDTYLRLYKGDNTLVIDNDDACGGNGSNFSYVAPASGWYILREGCIGSSACTGTVGYFVK